MKPSYLILVATLSLCIASPMTFAANKLKILIVDGQNNHSWQTTTPVLKWILETSGRFSVDVSTSPAGAPPAPRAPKKQAKEAEKQAFQEAQSKWKEQKAEFEKGRAERWKTWHPNFSNYDVIVSNYNGDSWPEDVRDQFLKYMQNGGGLVIFHAADNSFSEWPEYNEMIGVGGWGGRNEKSGPMLRYRDGKVVRDETPGPGGTHGPASEYVVEIRDTKHPITKGLPIQWLHAKDELYSKLRGPAKNLTVLATAHSSLTNENEPILMTIQYGKGRVFHDVLGHGPASMVDVGFQITLVRGTEWAATGKVTQPLPKAGEMASDKVITREPPAEVK